MPHVINTKLWETRKNIMHYNCAVTGCNACTRKVGKLDQYSWMFGVKFFSFPHKTWKARERKVWTDLIRRDNFTPSKYTKVCSRHFKDGEPTRENPHPTLFPYNNYGKPKLPRPVTPINKAARSAVNTGPGVAGAGTRPRRLSLLTTGSEATGPGKKPTAETRSLLIIPGDRIDVGNEVEIRSQPPVNQRCSKISYKGQYDTTRVPVIYNHEYCEPSSKEPPQMKNTACQTEISGHDLERVFAENEVLKRKLEDKDQLLTDLFYEKTTQDDHHIRTYYGLPNKSIFDGIYEVVSHHAGYLKYWSGKHSAKTMDYERHGRKRPGPKRKLDPRHEFALTLMKLRLGLLSYVLGDIFGISMSRVSQIFTTWISFLNQVITSPLLQWPSRTQVDQNMPQCFRKTYPKTRVIIDCSEFFIQCPGKPSTQHSTYSQYKSHNTYKVLFGIDPNGAFTFVSELWSGNVSDKYITKSSGLIELLDAGDEVMADRGFQIEDLLLPKAKLVAPPFTRKCKYGKQKRLNVKQIRTTRRIANLRIHVERAIQRIKTYRFLNGDLNAKYKGISNQAVRVAAAFCNIKPPLVK